MVKYREEISATQQFKQSYLDGFNKLIDIAPKQRRLFITKSLLKNMMIPRKAV